MTTFLYYSIIHPLYQIVEFCYEFCLKFTGNVGISVLGVSFAISFLCLPLYVIAENWQNKERKIQARMKTTVDRIKQTFSKDEQYMMLSAYYHEQHYHPMMALRSSISLLIQVPFFMAAYAFLSQLSDLRGCPFLFINDLGIGDSLFKLRTFPINVMPVLMTLINCIAGAIYTRGGNIKEKIQIYAMALLFLIILYNSPSGLVLYWTMNNIFSLAKNIFYRIKKPLTLLYRLFAVFSLIATAFILFVYNGSTRSKVAAITFLALIIASPLIIRFCIMLSETVLRPLQNKNIGLGIFLGASIFLSLFSGFLLPSNLIGSSPMEFSFVDNIASPFFFLRVSLWQGIGFCLLWPCCIYFLYGNRVRSLMTAGQILLSAFSVINAFVFTENYGAISTVFLFDRFYTPSASSVILNAMALLACILIVLLTLYKQAKILRPIFILASVTAIVLGTGNCINIAKAYGNLSNMRAQSAEVYTQKTTLEPIFQLSKTHKNVIVIMLDRAISGYVPQIFTEFPQLSDEYDGFTYYPNTISFGMYTLFGAPALYGGYEYTPYQMNLRSNEALVKKHNEALLLLPLIFSENGFSATVTDPTWANYKIVPDLSIYTPYPQISTHLTINHYTNIWKNQQKESFSTLNVSKLIRRNLILLSLFRSVSPVLRQAVYKTGDWWGTEKIMQHGSNAIDNYAVLDLLPKLTDTNAELGAYIALTNELTHSPQFLRLPDYTPTDTEITDFGSGPFAHEEHYHVNASAIRVLGKYFAYLKEQGVYDNTRIIIVSDHGRDVDAGIIDNRSEWNLPFELEYVNPLLLVKDFDAHGNLTVNNAFMTNADVPLLACAELIEAPINPFTGKLITASAKEENLYVAYSHEWDPDKNYRNTFKIPNDHWYTVHDSIFDIQNWRQETP